MAQIWLRNSQDPSSNFKTVGEIFFYEKLTKLDDSWCIWCEPIIAGTDKKPDFFGLGMLLSSGRSLVNFKYRSNSLDVLPI